jgi:protein-tyrosine phosphatase
MALRLAGALNFRDLGGMPADSGRHIREGVLFRSAALDCLTPEDIRALTDAQLRLVCDLRTARERDAAPSRLPSAPAPHVMLAHQEIGDIDPPAGSQDPGWAAQLADEVYAALPTVLASTIRELVDRVLDGEYPVIVHCGAGKDRTAWVIAVLQLALGVPREVIVEDYMLTDRYFGAAELRAALAERGPVDEDFVQAFRVHAPRLELAIRSAEPIDTYLSQSIGLDPDRRTRLIEILTEPD